MSKINRAVGRRVFRNRVLGWEMIVVIIIIAVIIMFSLSPSVSSPEQDCAHALQPVV